MIESLKSSEAMVSHYRLVKVRSKRKRGIYINIFFFSMFTIILWYQQYYGFENGHIGIDFPGYRTADRMFYELPLFWLPIIIVQLLLYHAEHIPGLKQWQDRLERKEFERLKSTYEYQQKL